MSLDSVTLTPCGESKSVSCAIGSSRTAPGQGVGLSEGVGKGDGVGFGEGVVVGDGLEDGLGD